ncbi:hypothetical protein [Endozoicomonas sp.]|uniref:hypothetical protein n=1 Tax=Endozoicomonas sp. TaxID=1892382 RepID=UPI002888C332|nr:hypothetical protein [Endozoicomonas sp.]
MVKDHNSDSIYSVKYQAISSIDVVDTDTDRRLTFVIIIGSLQGFSIAEQR